VQSRRYGEVPLLAAYGKNEKANLSMAERNAMKRLIPLLVSGYPSKDRRHGEYENESRAADKDASTSAEESCASRVDKTLSDNMPVSASGAWISRGRRAPKSSFATAVPSSIRTFDILPDSKRLYLGRPPGSGSQRLTERSPDSGSGELVRRPEAAGGKVVGRATGNNLNCEAR
jgi:hypothetical protein